MSKIEVKYWDSVNQIEDAVIGSLKLDPAKLGRIIIDNLSLDDDDSQVAFQAVSDEIAKGAVVDFAKSLCFEVNRWVDGDIVFLVDNIDWKINAESAGDDGTTFDRHWSLRAVITECLGNLDLEEGDTRDNHAEVMASTLELIASELRGKGP